MSDRRIGFVGLGDMGGPMAANIAAAGFSMLVYDAIDAASKAPPAATVAGSVAEVALASDTVFLSLPDGAVVNAVAREIAASRPPGPLTVVDLSTVGVLAARETDEILRRAGIAFVDAPVSGGRTGAVKGTITLMWSGPKMLMDSHAAVTKSFTGNVFHIGDRPGQGQAMKLLNNFLSASAMIATTEAVLFGEENGIAMKTALDVLNVSTGQNTATSDKFPNRILSRSFDAGFRTALMRKDVDLFLSAAEAIGMPLQFAPAVQRCWAEVDEGLPGSDFTEIYRFAEGRKGKTD